MKSLLFFIATIIIAQYGHSQSDWFPTGAKWYYQYGAMTGHGMTIIEVMDEDTIIGTRTYRKLLSTTTGEFPGDIDTFTETLYVTEENQVIYGYDQYQGGSFLYDFNALLEDTLPMSFGGLSPYPFVVDSIGEIEFNGHPLAFQDIRLPNLFEPGEYYEMRVMERIGSSHSHLFHGRTVIQPFDAPSYYLRCYEDDELGLIRLTDDNGPCNLLEGTSSTAENIASSITLFPNPAYDVVQFHNNLPDLAQLLVVDMLGAVRVKSATVNSATLQINISNLESGLYYIIGSGKTGETLFTRKISKFDY